MFVRLVTLAFLAVAIAVLLVIVASTVAYWWGEARASVPKAATEPPALHTYLDYGNGFVCYTYAEAISCHALWHAVPFPEAQDYVQQRLGQIFLNPSRVDAE